MKSMLINLLVIAVPFVCIENIYVLWTTIKSKDNSIDYYHFIACVVAVILIPIILFAFYIPNIVLTGEKDIYTQVKSSTGKEYDVMVLFDIRYEETEDEKHKFFYYPLTIKWSNGGECRNQLDEYGELGDWVDFEDQEGKEYEVKVSEPSYTFMEQLYALGTFDKIVYIVSFGSSLTIVIKYLLELKRGEQTQL